MMQLLSCRPGCAGGQPAHVHSMLHPQRCTNCNVVQQQTGSNAGAPKLKTHCGFRAGHRYIDIVVVVRSIDIPGVNRLLQDYFGAGSDPSWRQAQQLRKTKHAAPPIPRPIHNHCELLGGQIQQARRIHVPPGASVPPPAQQRGP